MPNTAVDMNSWAVSACYPQSTFYPLSDGPSIQNHRITKTYFRTCSTCLSAVKRAFAFILYDVISDHAERTFVLRYSLGGDRPSQTTHHTLSSIRITGPELEPQTCQGGISRMAPQNQRPSFKASHLSCTNNSKFSAKL